MRVKAAIAVASALFVVGSCSRPWQTSRADLAPMNPPPYGQTRYENSFDPPSQYPYGERAPSLKPPGLVSEPQPPPVWQGSRKVKTITIPAPVANQ
jgi:hypothetical protein